MKAAKSKEILEDILHPSARELHLQRIFILQQDKDLRQEFLSCALLKM